MASVSIPTAPHLLGFGVTYEGLKHILVLQEIVPERLFWSYL